MGIGIAAAARQPCCVWGFAAQSCWLSCSEGFSLAPTQVLGGTWVLHTQGLALPAWTPVPSRDNGYSRRCFLTRVLPAHPASRARSLGVSPQPWVPPGGGGCFLHPPRCLRRGGASPAPVAESGRQLPAGGATRPRGHLGHR